MSVTGHAGGGPLRSGLAVADCGTGIYAAVGILLALLDASARARASGCTARCIPDRADGLPGGALPERRRYARTGRQRPSHQQPHGPVRGQRRAFNLGASGEGNWKRLCDCLNAPQWLQDPRYATEKLRVANRAPLNEALARRFREASVAHWVELLNRAGVPAGPVYTIPQVFEDEQVRHLGVAQSVTGDDGQAYRLISQPVTLTHARRHRPARAGWGSTPTRCWPKRATTPPASRACARRAWYDRRVLAGRRQPAGHIRSAA